MTSISLFTSIDYARPCSGSEGALSVLSNYFYLGGVRATVIKGDQVRLQNGNESWSTIALKVASYVLLFPVTLILLTADIILRSRHQFTVMTTSSCNQVTHKEKSSKISSSAIKIKVGNLPQKKELVTTPSKATINAQSVENVRQEIITPPKEAPFRSFTIKIWEETLPAISSKEEMRLKAKELGRQVSDCHSQLRLDIPQYGIERQQAMLFIEELRAVADVITTLWKDIFYIIPKKTEEIKENITIRRYENGVIEEVHSSIKESEWEDWEGRRFHPNLGPTETGRFERFRLHNGIRVEKEITEYFLPEELFHSYELDRSLIYADIKGEEKLIVIRTKPGIERDFVYGHNFVYVQVNEELIPTLAKILECTGDIKSATLKKVLSGPIKIEEFVNYIFSTNSIFSLKSYPLRILLKIIQNRGIVVNLLQKHPETGETLLDRYSWDAKILKILLDIDSNLIQRTEGMEIAFIQALTAGNKMGASVILTAMEKQKLELLPREDLFKRLVFSEEKVALDELQALTQKDKEIVFRLANTYSQLDLVKTMRTLGFNRREELLMREGPSIFGCNMDVLEMYDRLKNFLINLRSKKLLLTQSEFDKPSIEKKYIKKGDDIGRILGRDYIEKKALELGLKHIKVPKKMIVMDDNSNLELSVERDLSIAVPYSIDKDSSKANVTVYAEEIQKSKRNIRAEEVKELLSLLEVTGFTDIHWGNIIVAEDGIYIIDTEFTNFWLGRYYFKKGRQYAEMQKIVYALPIVEQQIFIDELQRKNIAYRNKEQDLEKAREERFKLEEAALQKSGWSFPSFVFEAKEILTPL